MVKTTVKHISLEAFFTWLRIPCDDKGEIFDDFLVASDWKISILSPEQSQTKDAKIFFIVLNIIHR
jgi:hypothetical protein